MCSSPGSTWLAAITFGLLPHTHIPRLLATLLGPPGKNIFSENLLCCNLYSPRHIYPTPPPLFFQMSHFNSFPPLCFQGSLLPVTGDKHHCNCKSSTDLADNSQNNLEQLSHITQSFFIQNVSPKKSWIC